MDLEDFLKIIESRFDLGIKLNKDCKYEVGNIINLYTLHYTTDKSVAYDIKTGCTNKI